MPLYLVAQAEASALDLGGLLLSAFSSRNYPLAGALLLMLGVLAARKGGAKVLPWLGTPRGGAVLAAVGGGAAVLVARLAAGAPLSLGLALEALTASLTASGLWSTGKALVEKPKPEQTVGPVCSAADIANGKPGCV